LHFEGQAIHRNHVFIRFSQIVEAEG